MDESHLSGDNGGPLCGEPRIPAPMVIVTEELVTCPRCLVHMESIAGYYFSTAYGE